MSIKPWEERSGKGKFPDARQCIDYMQAEITESRAEIERLNAALMASELALKATTPEIERLTAALGATEAVTRAMGAELIEQEAALASAEKDAKAMRDHFLLLNIMGINTDVITTHKAT